MTSEDQDILARISQVAGQINRHKHGSVSMTQSPYQQTRSPSLATNTWHRDPSIAAHRPSTPYQAPWKVSRGGFASSRYPRGGRPQQVHRHKTLVLNGSAPSTPVMNRREAAADDEALPSSKRTKSGPTFIAKTDRHMQLINTDVYEKESTNRAKAMAESRQQKLLRRDQKEQARLARYLQRTTGRTPALGGITASAGPNTPAASYEITVEGIRFRVAKNGSKLLKCEDESSKPCATPKTALIGGVRFHRSKNGNMYRAGIVKAYRRRTLTTKINEPCISFSTTGTCNKGPSCPYTHDPSRVALCKDFLLTSTCPNGLSCDLSHTLSPERTPSCLHFAKGKCSNPSCRYSHVRVNPAAPVCRAFAIYGYCERGSQCDERHVRECPDFSATGRCVTKGCKLPHRHKAGVMRKNAEMNAVEGLEVGSMGMGNEEAGNNSDLSSEEEGDEIGRDDVDSDDLDEEMVNGAGSPALVNEQDWLGLV